MRSQNPLYQWAFVVILLSAGAVAAADELGFLDTFDIPHERFVAVGRNPYFILQPGSVYEYAGRQDSKPAKMTVTVLKETATIDGVETRIVEAKRSLDSRLVEISRTYLAVDSFTKDIYCFGKDVDAYKDGQLDGHPGSWRAGVKDGHYALYLPARSKMGQKFYSALAAPIAMDRIEITSTTEKKKVPAGTFEKCLKLRQTSPLDPKVARVQLFAPGVGKIVDGELELVKYPKPQLGKDGKPLADSGQPIVPLDQARAALDQVGADPAALDTWLTAINDPSLSDHDRQDLIEDLNESGLPDAHNLSADDLPLILSRIDVIEQFAPEAMDQVNADAFDEAYKDLTNMADKLSRQ